MQVLPTFQLLEVIASHFPLNATCWSQATDEPRDMCRMAREELQLDETHAVNFRALDTPSDWNTSGIQGIGNFYDWMTDDQKLSYLTRLKEYFPQTFASI